MDLPEVTIFMEEFLSSFGKTLDELTLSKEEQAVASEDLS